MQYYKAKVRLGGSTMNEVEKVLSAPEVLILQFIHGIDALVNVVTSHKKAMDPREEKERLRAKYDQALVKRKQSIDTIFGPLGSVPDELPFDMLERFDIVDEDDVIAVAKSIIKKEKAVNKTHREPENLTQANRLDRIVPAEEVSLDEMAG